LLSGMALLSGPSLAVSGCIASVTMLLLPWQWHLDSLTSFSDEGSHEVPAVMELADDAVDKAGNRATIPMYVMAVVVFALELSMVPLILRVATGKLRRPEADAPKPSAAELHPSPTVEAEEAEHDGSVHSGSPVKRSISGEEVIAAESTDVSTEDDTAWLRRRLEADEENSSFEHASDDPAASLPAASSNSEEECSREILARLEVAARREAAEANRREAKGRRQVQTTWRMPPRVLRCLDGCSVACDETIGTARSVMITHSHCARGICCVPITCTAFLLGLVHALVDGVINGIFQAAGEEPIELTLRRGFLSNISLSTICEGEDEESNASTPIKPSPVKPSPIKPSPIKPATSQSSGGLCLTRSP